MTRRERTLRVLTAAAIAVAVGSGVAWAAAGVAVDNAAAPPLRFGGTLTARPLGAVPPRTAAPNTPLATATLYDSFTGATYTTTTGSPRTFIGAPFTLIDPLLTPIEITQGTFYLLSTAAVSYTNVVLNVQFYDGYAPASSPVFSSPTGGVQSFTIGPLSTASNTIYSVPVTFAAPITFAALTNRGVAINYQGDTGSGLASTDALTSTLRHTGAFAVGTSSLNGFFRNASGRTDLNFDSTDARTFTGLSNISVAMILRGNATFPVGLQSLTAE